MVRSPNPAQTAIVGTPISYDATNAGATFSDPRGGGLTYVVAFAPAANGFTTSAGHVGDVPIQPGIVTTTITAIDAKGGNASQSFPILTFAAGLSAPQLPAIKYRYADGAVPLPPHFVSSSAGSVLGADNMPPHNPTTDVGAALGRVLFCDTRLSANDRVACGSCHQQAFGSGDTARFSRGLAGGLTSHQSMGLANARFYQNPRFFRDKRAASLDAQVLQPIQNDVEMGMNLDDRVLKLSVTRYYGALFQSAFGAPAVTSERIARALAQFVRSLVSASVRFDSVFIGGGPPDLTRLSAPEREGHQLFTGAARCASCHRTNTQFGDNARNTGLDAAITGVGAGSGRFKSPSLRNIAVRPPIMHDGRFGTLLEVVAFYDSGVQPYFTMAPSMEAICESPGAPSPGSSRSGARPAWPGS